jgi:hypothetical protein
VRRLPRAAARTGVNSRRPRLAGMEGWEIAEGELRTGPPRMAGPSLVGAFLSYHAAAFTDHGDTVIQLALSPMKGGDQPACAP